MTSITEDTWDEDDHDLLIAASHAEANLSKNSSKETSQNSSSKETSQNSSSKDSSSPPKSVVMDAAGRARAERNRLKALALKRARLRTRGDDNRSKVLLLEKKLVDTDAGFFIEEEGETNEEETHVKVQHLPAPIVESDQPHCLDCQSKMADSYLLRTFDYGVCDKCRDTERDGKHELMTKTEAKSHFLLTDQQLDGLKFVVRKNPHNERWGDMKLFLRLQVETKALEVWGTEEALESAHAEREARREKSKSRKMQKQIKALRMQVRGSLYQRDLSGHEHEYGEESYDEQNDEYSRTCKTCGHVHTYEKM